MDEKVENNWKRIVEEFRQNGWTVIDNDTPTIRKGPEVIRDNENE
jgi:hypothetical protein